MEYQATKSPGIARRMVATLIVAIGVAVVWGLVVVWVASIVESWMRSGSLVYENVAVTRSGIPVIQSYSVADYQNITYRTLDGQPIEVGNNDSLRAAYLMQPVRPPRFFNSPLGWGQSLAASDFARPRGGWYLVRDNEPRGRAYFVGYDEFSKMPIGYLGRQGFRRGMPPRDEWFDVGLSNGYYMGAASSQRLDYNSRAAQYDPGTERDNLPAWLVFVIDGERLQEVNLQERTVREVFTSTDLVSVGVLTEPTSQPTNDEAAPDISKTVSRVAVRTRNSIFVLDPAADAKREFLLAESLPDKAFSTYVVDPNQLLLYWTTYDEFGGQTQHLVWLGVDGTISREEEFQLAQAVGEQSDPRLATTLATGVAPIPVGWATMLGAIAPIGLLNGNEVPTYAAAMSKIISIAWPGLLIVTAIGCMSAWVVWRWQRRYFRPATGAWCTFAFLVGLPGVVAYWLEMRRAKLERCGECRTIVPRDRDACAACATPFPAPPLVGTEIFG